MKDYTITLNIRATDTEQAQRRAARAAKDIDAEGFFVSRGKSGYIAIYLDPDAVREHYEDGLEEDELEGAPTHDLNDEQILKAVEALLFSSDYLWGKVWDALEGELKDMKRYPQEGDTE